MDSLRSFAILAWPDMPVRSVASCGRS